MFYCCEIFTCERERARESERARDRQTERQSQGESGSKIIEAITEPRIICHKAIFGIIGKAI